jgi:hypothetical protein
MFNDINTPKITDYITAASGFQHGKLSSMNKMRRNPVGFPPLYEHILFSFPAANISSQLALYEEPLKE